MNDQNCRFHFEAPPGRRIVVFFEDFDLEEDFDFIILRKLHIMYITFYVRYLNVLIFITYVDKIILYGVLMYSVSKQICFKKQNN